MNEFERYNEIYDKQLREFLMTYYKKSYREGWYIKALVRLDQDKWIIKWEKSL